MANIMAMITLIIRIWAFVLTMSFIRGILYLAPGVKLGVSALEFYPLTLAWETFMYFGQQFVLITGVVFLMLWVIYEIFSRIFPISLFIKHIPPIRELINAGIFGLFRALLGIIVSKERFAVRFKNCLIAFGLFIKQNFTFKSVVKREPMTTNATKSTPVFSQEDIQRSNEEFQQCLEEKITVITPEMTALEAGAAKFKNSSLEIQCKVQAMQTALNNFGYSK